MTVAHIYRITFKQKKLHAATIKRDKITNNEKGNEQWSFVCWNHTSQLTIHKRKGREGEAVHPQQFFEGGAYDIGRWKTNERLLLDSDAENVWRWLTSWKTSKKTVRWHNRLLPLYTARGCSTDIGQEEMEKNDWPQRPIRVLMNKRTNEFTK